MCLHLGGFGCTPSGLWRHSLRLERHSFGLWRHSLDPGRHSSGLGTRKVEHCQKQNKKNEIAIGGHHFECFRAPPPLSPEPPLALPIAASRPTPIFGVRCTTGVCRLQVPGNGILLSHYRWESTEAVGPRSGPVFVPFCQLRHIQEHTRTHNQQPVVGTFCQNKCLARFGED